MSLPAIWVRATPWPENPCAKKPFGGNPSDVRKPAHRDREPAAPRVIDPHVRKLGKHPEHVAADERLRVVERPVGVGLAAAEQESGVGRAPVVVHDELRRVHARAAGNERAGAILAERLGREHVVDDRHDPGLDPRLQAAEIGVAGEDDVPRLDDSLRGGYPRGGAPPNPARPRSVRRSGLPPAPRRRPSRARIAAGAGVRRPRPSGPRRSSRSRPPHASARGTAFGTRDSRSGGHRAPPRSRSIPCSARGWKRGDCPAASRIESRGGRHARR